MTNDIREKTQAVFLAAIMVLSMVAMTATFAGAAAAQNATTANLEFNDQDLADDGTVTVENVTTDGDAAIVVTYTAENGDEIVAGLDSVGDVSEEDVSVLIENDTGFPGEHTAWAFDPADVQGVTVGDTVPTNVAGDAIAGPETATVSAGSSDVGNSDGLTVGPPDTVYRTPQDRASSADLITIGSDVVSDDQGLIGVPFGLGPFPSEGNAQTVTQEHSIAVDTVRATPDGETDELVIDFSESVEAGFEFDVNTTAVESEFAGAFDELDASDVDATFAEDTLTVEYALDNGATGVSMTFDDEISLQTEDLTDGIDSDLNENLEHEMDFAGATDDDPYRFVATGEITLNASDFTIQDDSQTLADTTVVRPDEPTGTSDAFTGEGIEAYAGTDITLLAASEGDSFTVHTAEEDDDSGNLTTGDDGLDINPIGTAPGLATTIDTADLPDENGEYLIENDETGDLFYVDLEPLNLDTSAPADEITTDDELEFDVSSNDIGNTDYEGAIQAWFYEAGDVPRAANTIHVEEDNFLGDGEATVSVDPSEDLDGTGEYAAIVAHVESGNFVLTDTVEVVDPVDESVSIESPRPSSAAYDRGDIFEVVLDLEGTDTATVTLGDRDAQNLEINYTVQTDEVGGEARFLINSYQIGDGVVNNDTATTADGTTVPGSDWGNKMHGAIDVVDDSTTVVSAEAHSDIKIGGGSNDNANRQVVLAGNPTSYDLVASPGETAFSAPEAFPTDSSNVRFESRETGDLNAWKAPAPGDVADLDNAEFVDTIDEALEEGRINPQQGSQAEEDLLVLTIESEGLEGVLANTAQQEGYLEEFLDREEDHLVTQAFEDSGIVDFSTIQDSDQVNETEEEIQEDPEENLPGDEIDLDPATLPLDRTDVLARTDERGTLSEYILTYPVNEGNIVDAEDEDRRTADQRPVNFISSFDLTPPEDSASEDFPLNDFFDAEEDGSFSATVAWDLVEDDIALNDVEEVDGEERLLVPPRAEYEITGETPIAGGTSLTTTVRAAAGEEPQFFYPGEATVEHVDDAPNTVSFTENFDTFEGESLENSEFTVNIRRSRLPGSLMEGDEPFPGTVQPRTNVSEHVFEDQTTAGETIEVAQVTVNQDAAVEIRNADGDVLGSAELTEGENTNVSVLLDESISEDQELTSVVVDTDGNEFDADSSSAPVSATASVTVDTGEVDPFYVVQNLDPVVADAAPGDELEVSAEIRNTGGDGGAQDVEFQLDGASVDGIDAQTVELDSGETETVTFTVTAPDVDEETVFEHGIASADDSATGQLTITPLAEANFELTLDSGPSEVETGDDISVTVTVENTGDLEATQDITFTFDGNEVGSQSVTLAGGESASQTFNATAPEEEGDFDWEIASEDDSISQTLSVVAPMDDEDMDDEGAEDEGGEDEGGDNQTEDSDDSGPGFGIAAAMIALLGAALLAYRRRLN